MSKLENLSRFMAWVKRLEVGGDAISSPQREAIEAVAAGNAVVIIGRDLEPLDDGKPIVWSFADGTTEFRFRTRSTRQDAFVIDCHIHGNFANAALRYEAADVERPEAAE